MHCGLSVQICVLAHFWTEQHLALLWFVKRLDRIPTLVVSLFSTNVLIPCRVSNKQTNKTNIGTAPEMYYVYCLWSWELWPRVLYNFIIILCFSFISSSYYIYDIYIHNYVIYIYTNGYPYSFPTILNFITISSCRCGLPRTLITRRLILRAGETLEAKASFQTMLVVSDGVFTD